MGYREFVDREGIEWRVWDTRPRTGANVRRALAAGWVTFQSGAERRRLSPVPRGWADGSDDDLLRWLARAEPIPELEERDEAPADAREGTVQAELTGRTGSVLRRARQVLRKVEETLRHTRHTPPPD